jgi:site-specific DNA-methyltransferase (adenine-specific)
MPGDLHYGDNLDVLRQKVATASVDLVYLDPPFNSDRNYNLLQRASQSQQDAFVDTWHWEDAAERAFAELTGHAPPGVVVPDELGDMMKALKRFLWKEQRNTLAYLSMMAIRLVEMRRVLRSTGSLYLHCDPTASHYLKMILDGLFGIENFRNEIIWKRTGAHNSAEAFGPVHDVILFYARSSETRCHPSKLKHSAKYLEKFGKVDPVTGKNFQDVTLTGPGTRKGESGQPWRNYNPTEKGRHWAIPKSVYDNYREIVGEDLHQYPLLDRLEKVDNAGLVYWTRNGQPRYKQFLDDVEAEGASIQDIWTDISPVNSQANEATGLNTQKPLPLLARIIEASSSAGDLVLDPFCGCGTTIEACEGMGRKWIGIDIAIRQMDVIKDRLDAKFQPRVWKEYGEPSGVDEAAHLADTNPYDFQWWAVRKLGGQPPKGEKKKGGDGGIDGRMTLQDFTSSTNRSVIVSVKGGRTLTPEMVKSLDTTVRLERADYGFLVTMHPPTPGMRAVARECGTLPGSTMRDGKLAHRIRIITIPEILAGTVQLPGVNITPRSQSSPPPPEPRKGETLHLPFPARGKAKPTKRPSKAAEVASAARAARQADAEEAEKQPRSSRRR